MLLVKYKETNTIEGYVKNYEEFKEWLKRHNKNRKQEGSIKENENEFELILIENLNALKF